MHSPGPFRQDGAFISTTPNDARSRRSPQAQRRVGHRMAPQWRRAPADNGATAAGRGGMHRHLRVP
eukprot:11835439-Alexandrium_andersonii.AAC.1